MRRRSTWWARPKTAWPSSYVHNIDYVNGNTDWSQVVPAALVGLSRAFRIDLDKYLSPAREGGR